MIDNNILLDLVKRSTTQAVKYVHEIGGKPIPEAKEFVAFFKIENGIDLPNGTITWFEYEKVKPPVVKNNTSDIILIWKENSIIVEATYNSIVDKFFHIAGNWQPTHWAFINLPK
jgi:hypothetical protein